MAVTHKERLATLHAICLQISLQSLFRIFSHASCVHIFRDISGKYSKIHKGFSPFFPSSLENLTTHLSHNLCAVLPYIFSHGSAFPLRYCHYTVFFRFCQDKTAQS